MTHPHILLCLCLTLLSLAALLGGAVGTALWYGDVVNYEMVPG